MKKEKAITLISLVITIIVLIILAGLAIYLSLGNNGIFTRAEQAKEETNKQTATEKINLKITTAQINSYSEKQEMPTLKELSLALENDDEIAYVTEVSQIASTKYEVGDDPTSIFTKLKEYPYEFEINSSLQLASINGVKVANNDTITIPKDEYDKLKNANLYSTNEVIVGTWIDGKPIYRKTCTGKIVDEDYYTIATIENLDIFLGIDSQASYIMNNIQRTITTLYSFIQRNGDMIQLTYNGTRYYSIGSDYAITIQYTKTTD